MKSIVTSIRERLQPPKVSEPAPAPIKHPLQEADPARPDRPYWDRRTAPLLPPVGVFADILRRVGDPGLVEADERRELQHTQRKIDRLTGAIRELDITGIRLAAKAARRRLVQGRGTRADAAFDANNLIAGRKGLKRERNAAIESARPTLTIIAKRVEDRARRVLPAVEGEARALGLQPGHPGEAPPLVRLVGSACWTPSVCAATTIHSPREFLRQLAMKL